jgi:hypothetical protein
VPALPLPAPSELSPGFIYLDWGPIIGVFTDKNLKCTPEPAF